jgi:hypothetical protein
MFISISCAPLQVVASVLQLQSLASQQHKRNKPLAIVASLNSSTTEDVLWHTTLSYHAELQADAARAVELRNDAKLRRHKNKKKEPKLEDAAAAAAAVRPPVSLHLLRPDELMSGMLTQVGLAGLDWPHTCQRESHSCHDVLHTALSPSQLASPVRYAHTGRLGCIGCTHLPLH